MNGATIQQLLQHVVILVSIVYRLWRPIPGGATAKGQLASNSRNGPFRPTPAASPARYSPTSSWTSSSKSKKDFMFKDALFDSSLRTRPRSPRPSMARRSTNLLHQDACTSRLHLGALLSRWTSPTRPTSLADATSQSADVRHRGGRPGRTQFVDLASLKSSPGTSFSTGLFIGQRAQAALLTILLFRQDCRRTSYLACRGSRSRLECAGG